MEPVTLLPNSILSLSGETADRLLSLGDGDASLVYLSLLRRGSVQIPGWPQSRVQAALDKLSACGLTAKTQLSAPADPPQEQPPEYTVDDLTAALSSGSSFCALADEVERRLGKKLSTSDLKTLYTIYDFLALPAEVILLLVSWCTMEQERKYGAGRKPFLSQIRREAFRWAREGVDTAERAEEHLQRLLRLRSREGEVIRLLDLPNRPLVEREQKYIAAWLDMGFDSDALRLAYEKTVMGTASRTMDWRYMNKILLRWHEKGLHTVAQVQAGDSAPRRPAPQPASADPDRRAREDAERARRLLQQMTQEQGG